MAGTWRRNAKGHAGGVEMNIAEGLSQARRDALEKARQRYVAFMDELEPKAKTPVKSTKAKNR